MPVRIFDLTKLLRKIVIIIFLMCPVDFAGSKVSTVAEQDISYSDYQG